jgi:hypothetical protein
MEVNIQLRASASLPPGKELSLPIGYEAVYAQSRSGRRGGEKKMHRSHIIPEYRYENVCESKGKESERFL